MPPGGGPESIGMPGRNAIGISGRNVSEYAGAEGLSLLLTLDDHRNQTSHFPGYPLIPSQIRLHPLHHTANRLEKGFAVLRLLEDGFAFSSPVEDMIPTN